jgi:hypothetical protein
VSCNWYQLYYYEICYLFFWFVIFKITRKAVVTSALCVTRGGYCKLLPSSSSLQLPQSHLSYPIIYTTRYNNFNFKNKQKMMTELWEHMCTFLPLPDIYTLAQVSQLHTQICSHNSPLWLRLLKQHSMLSPLYVAESRKRIEGLE